MTIVIRCYILSQDFLDFRYHRHVLRKLIIAYLKYDEICAAIPLKSLWNALNCGLPSRLPQLTPDSHGFWIASARCGLVDMPVLATGRSKTDAEIQVSKRFPGFQKNIFELDFAWFYDILQLSLYVWWETMHWLYSNVYSLSMARIG